MNQLSACGVAVLVGLTCLTGQAQQDSASPQTDIRDFAEVHPEWEQLREKMDALIKAFEGADQADRNQLIGQYEALADRSRQILPELRAAALNAYQSAPNENDDVTKTLISFMANDVQQDKYESAMELGQILADGQCAEPILNTFAGIAAYCMDDFAVAEEFLAKAKAADAMNQVATNCEGDVQAAKVAWAAEQAIRAKEAEANDLPRVQLETTKGPLVIELYENEAPGAVGNFVSLVESQFYDGLTFHRVLPGFMAQGGCPDGTGRGGPGYKIPCECQQDNHRKHFRGTLSMAHAGRDTGGSQFFLTFKRTAHLDGRHTVFGRVIEGLDVLERIQRLNPGAPNQAEPDKIVKATVLRKRDHEYAPVKVK